MGIGNLNIGQIVHLISIAAIPLIFAITFHEAAHGWVAHKFGDNTAFSLGRVTANPIKHIDPIGTVVVPIILLVLGGFIFGWAKPVPVRWNNLRNPRRDMALVALAGPVANFIMAIFWALIAKLALISLGGQPQATMKLILSSIYLASLFGITINCVLFLLNLLPIPPLDGSRVVSSLLPPKAALIYSKIEPYGIWILLGLIFLGVLKTILWPPLTELIQYIRGTFGLLAP